MTSAELVSDIEREFANEAHPGWETACNGHPGWDRMFIIGGSDIEELKAAIDVGRSWMEISTNTLRRSSVAMLCTTPVAFKVFLPALMRAAVLDAEELDVGVISLLEWLCRCRRDWFASQQYDALSESQRAVIRKFIAYAVRQRLDDDSHLDELLRVWGLSTEELGLLDS